MISGSETSAGISVITMTGKGVGNEIGTYPKGAKVLKKGFEKLQRVVSPDVGQSQRVYRQQVGPENAPWGLHQPGLYSCCSLP